MLWVILRSLYILGSYSCCYQMPNTSNIIMNKIRGCKWIIASKSIARTIRHLHKTIDMHATKPNCIDHRPVVEFERGVQYYIHMFIYDIHVYNDTYERWNVR